MKSEFPKIPLLLVLSLGFLFSVSCTNSQASNSPGTESQVVPSRSTASENQAIAVITGIWKFDVASTAGKANLPEMGDLRYEFKSNSRVRIYQRTGQRVEWIENVYAYSPQLQMLIIDDPSKYRGTTQVELVPKDANTFAIEAIIKGGSVFPPNPLIVSQTLNLVRTGEAFAFEKDIENGASLSGEPVKKMPPAMSPTQNLIGTWSFAALEDTGYYHESTLLVSPLTPYAGYPPLQLKFKSDGTGYLLSQEKESIAVVSFRYVISAISRQIFLYENKGAVFAVLTLSDFDTDKMTIANFDSRYLKTTEGKEVITGGSSFSQGFAMRFKKIADAEALDKKIVAGGSGKPGLSSEYGYGIHLDEVKPLTIAFTTDPASQKVKIDFDRARPHCEWLSDKAFAVNDKQTKIITENGIQYEVEDRIQMRLTASGTRKRYGFNYYGEPHSGTMEVEKTIRQLDQNGRPISADPQGHIFAIQKDTLSCEVKKIEGQFSRSKLAISCSDGLEGKSMSGQLVTSVDIETTCEMKR